MSTTLNLNLTVANSITFYGDSKNAGKITTKNAIFRDESQNLGQIIGNATFYDDSENAGFVSKDATFNDRSVHTADGTVNGNALFNDCSKGNGTVNGQTAYPLDRPPISECAGYIFSDPPLKASWVTSGRNRRLVIIPSINFDQFQALNLPIAPIYGPWQPCPDGASCFAYPARYRRFMPADYVIDYENNQHYLEEPGNPEPLE